jgi:hypothetical protein
MRAGSARWPRWPSLPLTPRATTALTLVWEMPEFCSYHFVSNERSSLWIVWSIGMFWLFHRAIELL